jgi:Uma2 family endonuclease
MLVQYPIKGQKRPGQVVPDNMVVVHDGPVKVEGSYDVPLQPVGPFWVLEYVSKSSERKDYDDNMLKYEKQLKVPFSLIFYPENQELTLFRHTGRKYATVRPNEHGRYAVAPLEIEVALLDGWVRFWFRGELLPLPAEMHHALQETREELARVKAELERLRAKNGTRPR